MKFYSKIFYNQGNEWKTRFENQEEINRHLARQIILLEKNIAQAREEQRTGMSTTRNKINLLMCTSAKARATKADPNEVKSIFLQKQFDIFLNFKVNQEEFNAAENDKKNLLSQLRDYEWRLEQENKVTKFYFTNSK